MLDLAFRDLTFPRLGSSRGGGGAPIVTVPGSIDEQPLVGVASVITEPTVTGSVGVTYQWYRGLPPTTPISGATSATYTPVDADYGLTLYRRATYAGPGGSLDDDLDAPDVVGKTYVDDWAGYTIGNTWTQIDAAYNRNGTGIDPTVVASSLSPSGKAARAVANVSNNRIIWRADAATFGLANTTPTTKTQALFLWTHTGANSGRYNLGFVEETLVWTGPRVTVISNSARLQIESEDVNATTGTLLSALTPGTAYWLRLEQEGNQIRAKLWVDGDPEPGPWDATRTRGSSLDQPAPGFATRFASAYPAAQFDLHYWSGGYNTAAPYWPGYVAPFDEAADPMTYAAPAAATSFAQNDGKITYNFTSANQGRYVNGDPFLVNTSGITITSMAPASQDSSGRWINGAMENPGEGQSGFGNVDQGFDSHVSASGPNLPYVAGENIDPGRTGSSLVYASGVEASILKAVSNPSPTAPFGRDRLEFAGVMTVVASAPATDAFRPGYSAPAKVSKWTYVDMIDPATFRNLAPPSSIPSVNQMVAGARWPIMVWNCGNDPQWPLTPTGNHRGYGADFAQDLATQILALSMNIDATIKRNIAVSLVQRGIDVFERLEQGGDFNNGNGGHSADKLPLAVAAYLLDDADMKAYLGASPPVFVEDNQYQLINATDVSTYGYPAGDVGGPEWKINGPTGFRDPSTGATYRTVNTMWQVGAALGLQLLGARTVYNNEVFFNYVDRIMERTFNNGSGPSAWANGLTAGGNSPPQFHKDAWASYRTASGMPAVWNW